MFPGVQMFMIFMVTHEPPHDKANKMACAPSEDSDQPGHSPSLIGVFVVRMKKLWVLSYPLSASEDSDQAEQVWILSCCGSCFLYLTWAEGSQVSL